MLVANTTAKTSRCTIFSKRMNKLFALIISFFVIVSPAVAATPTPATGSATKSNSLNELKERLATKVAELRTTEKRALFGTVKTLSETTLVVETKTKDIKVELTDEVKVVQYLKGKRTALSLADIEKGDPVTVYGDYDTTLELLKASFVLIETIPPLRVSGVVKDIDRNDYSLTLTGFDGQTYTIDIETTTKVTGWNKTNKFTKSGFSRMVEGETIHVVGTPVPKKENRLSALRILNLGNPVGEPPPIPTPTPTPEESTPSATPKTSPETTPKGTPTP